VPVSRHRTRSRGCAGGLVAPVWPILWRSSRRPSFPRDSRGYCK
jgi:hypothetical protein